MLCMCNYIWYYIYMCVCGYCIMYMNHIYIRFYKCVGYKCENQIEVVPKREWCDVGMTVSGTKMKKKISHLYTFTVSICDMEITWDHVCVCVCSSIFHPPIPRADCGVTRLSADAWTFVPSLSEHQQCHLNHSSDVLWEPTKAKELLWGVLQIEGID